MSRGYVWLKAFVFSAIVLLLALVVSGWWLQPLHAFKGRELWHDGTDFAAFYSAGKLIWSGHGEDIYNVDAIGPIERAAAPQFPEERVLPYLNPPFFAAALSPLSNLPFKDAYRAWTLFNLALLASISLMIWTLLREAPLKWRLFSVIATLTLYPTTTVLREGQFSLILLASWLLTFMLLRRNDGRLAGLAFVPTLIKPELAVPVILFFAWKRQWDFVGTFSLACGALVALSVFIIGPVQAIHYPQYLIEIASRDGFGTNTAAFFGWNGILAASLGKGQAAFVTIASIPLIALTLALIVYRWRDLNGVTLPYLWASLTLGCILADPHFYIHDTVLVVAAWVAIASSGAHQSTLLLMWGVLGWMVLATGYNLHNHLEVNLFGWFMVCALLVLSTRVEQSRIARAPRGQAAGRVSLAS